MGKNHKHRWLDKIVPGYEYDPKADRLWLKVCTSCGEGQIVRVVYDWKGVRRGR